MSITASTPVHHPRPAIVCTRSMDLLVKGAPKAFKGRWVVAVDGPPGCGKTTALDALYQWWPGPKSRVELETSSTHKDVIAQLHREVVGFSGTSRGLRRADMTQQLRHALAGEQRLVIVDEAQKGGIKALEMLRQIHQDPTARWGLVLAGAALTRKLEAEPMLDSRVGLRVRFDRLDGMELCDLLVQMHPLFAAMPNDLIEAADVVCKGVLREWVKVLFWLMEFTRPGHVPTKANVEQALTAIAGRPVRLP